MRVAARLLKAALWDVWAQSQIGPSPLRTALQNQAVSARAALNGGPIKMNTANGHTTIFFGDGETSFTITDVVEAWVYLVELFDICAAELGGAPTDSQVEARMELALRPIKGMSDNWMYLSK